MRGHGRLLKIAAHAGVAAYAPRLLSLPGGLAAHTAHGTRAG